MIEPPAFISGNPGTTQRLQTVAQLQTLRDLALPHQQLLRSELRGRLIRFSEESAENRRVANGRARRVLGWRPAFGDYRSGLLACISAGG